MSAFRAVNEAACSSTPVTGMGYSAGYTTTDQSDNESESAASQAAGITAELSDEGGEELSDSETDSDRDEVGLKQGHHTVFAHSSLTFLRSHP